MPFVLALLDDRYCSSEIRRIFKDNPVYALEIERLSKEENMDPETVMHTGLIVYKAVEARMGGLVD